MQILWKIELWEGVETGTQQAFIWYLEKHGIPSGFATQFANGINVLGGFESFIGLYSNPSEINSINDIKDE